MNGKDNFGFRPSCLLMTKQLFILGIIVTSIFSSVLILLNQNQFALAQQQQQEQQPQTNGNSFQLDNMTFSHNTASVNGIKLHYVIGGHGPPVILLHGWPETWYAWHTVMPALAKNYTVIAPDLRGLGDSSKPTTGYDGKTVAEDIHQLVTKLGYRAIFLVGHDIGTQVAYSYAAAHPTEVKKLAVMELTIPGFAPPGRLPIWWGIFHQVPDVPEVLVQGKEMMYLS
jgi:alpha-beta hydrolase superfamily lysophospholipase